MLMNTKLGLLALAALLGLLNSAYAQSGTAASETKTTDSSAGLEDDLTDYGNDMPGDDTEDDEEATLEDTLADLAIEHRFTRMDCKEFKSQLDEAKSNGTSPDPELQSTYEDCMTYLGQINDDMSTVLEAINADKNLTGQASTDLDLKSVDYLSTDEDEEEANL